MRLYSVPSLRQINVWSPAQGPVWVQRDEDGGVYFVYLVKTELQHISNDISISCCCVSGFTDGSERADLIVGHIHGMSPPTASVESSPSPLHQENSGVTNVCWTVNCALQHADSSLLPDGLVSALFPLIGLWRRVDLLRRGGRPRGLFLLSVRVCVWSGCTVRPSSRGFRLTMKVRGNEQREDLSLKTKSF